MLRTLSLGEIMFYGGGKKKKKKVVGIGDWDRNARGSARIIEEKIKCYMLA